MFALRTVSNGVRSNQDLGTRYSVVNRETNPEQFRDTFKVVFLQDHVADSDPTADEITRNVYGFVISPQQGLFPLYKNDENYIMTDGGKTFESISY